MPCAEAQKTKVCAEAQKTKGYWRAKKLLSSLVDDNLWGFVDIEAGDGRLGAVVVPDLEFNVAKFRHVLIGGDLGSGDGGGELEVASQHAVLLVGAEGGGGDFVQVELGVLGGVFVYPIENAGDVVGPILAVHAEGGGAGRAAGDFIVKAGATIVGIVWRHSFFN